MTTALTKYDAACRAIAAAKTVDEAAKIRDGAEAMRAYGRIAKNRQVELDGAEIRLRAERRIGELVTNQARTVGLHRGGRPSKTPSSREGVLLRHTLKQAGIDYKLSTRAQRLAQMPVRKFESLVSTWRVRTEQEHERITTNLLRHDDRATVAAARPTPALPPGRYRLLYVDPPWRYEHVVTESRAIENQYPTMAHDELCALAVPAADDAVLFLWATSPKLAEAIDLMRAWRFDYRTCAVWDKATIGMGYYFRQQHELLLVAARGALAVPDPSTRPPSVIRAPRGTHSAKPAVVHTLLEQMYPTFTDVDRIELFARTPRPGWSQWSNEPALSEAAG